MQRYIFSFFIFYLLSFSSFAQHTNPVDIYLKQGKDSIHINDQTINVKRLPFTLIIVYNEPKLYSGVFLNTSLTKDYYRLPPSKHIPDLQYLPQKVYSENKFNPNKELKVNSEFFQYFGYNPNANWNKFDRLIKSGNKIIAYRKVTNFTVVVDDRNIPVEEMRYNLYLTFEVITKRNAFSNNEIYRTTTKLKF